MPLRDLASSTLKYMCKIEALRTIRRLKVSIYIRYYEKKVWENQTE